LYNNDKIISFQSWKHLIYWTWNYVSIWSTCFKFMKCEIVYFRNVSCTRMVLRKQDSVAELIIFNTSLLYSVRHSFLNFVFSILIYNVITKKYIFTTIFLIFIIHFKTEILNTIFLFVKHFVSNIKLTYKNHF